ncbi:MAG: hypothetical protein AAFV53_14360 [Myxococcota bacterium]
MYQLASRWLKSYVFAQVMTGVEVGVLAALLVVGVEVSLPAALAITFPLGLPLVALQTALSGWWLGRSTVGLQQRPA